MYKTIPALFALGGLFSGYLWAAPAQECIGRLVFDIPDTNNFQWALNERRGVPTIAGLSSGLSDWYYNQNRLNVTIPETKEARKRIIKSYQINPEAEIDNLKFRNERLQTLLKVYEESQKNAPEILFEEDRLEQKADQEKIAEYKKEIKQNLAEIARYKTFKPTEPTNLRYPDAFTVTFTEAYFWREGRTFAFAFDDRANKQSLQQINQRFANFVSRPLGTVPTQSPAFCFPYGLMKDDGTPEYEIKNAFRFKDQPNVLYAIYTGSIRRHDDAKTIESTLPVARYGLDPLRLMMPEEPENYKRITDFKKTVPIGNQQMEITGVIFTEIQPKDPQHPEYAYFLAGQIRNTYKNTESVDKPYIGFQISGLPRDQEKGLTTKAPSPEEAIERVTPLLKSMHLGLQADRKDEI